MIVITHPLNGANDLLKPSQSFSVLIALFNYGEINVDAAFTRSNNISVKGKGVVVKMNQLVAVGTLLPALLDIMLWMLYRERKATIM